MRSRDQCFQRKYSSPRNGFTIIEMLVVMTVVALLLAVASPAYLRHLSTAREVALRHDLRSMRDALDKFKADQSRYPTNLQELVTHKYLRTIPADPLTERTTTWVIVPAQADLGTAAAPMADVRSGAPGKAQDGSDYASW